MSLQSNKCLRFFRKYILYNTKIIFGPKNQEITNLHLLFFYKVNQMEFWIPPWELCWAQGTMWVLNAGTPSWRELTPPAAHCTRTALGVSLPQLCPTAPVTAAQRELGPHPREKPRVTLLGQGRCRGLKGTKFRNLERHQSSGPPQWAQEHRRGSASTRDRTLLTNPLWPHPALWFQH